MHAGNHSGGGTPIDPIADECLDVGERWGEPGHNHNGCHPEPAVLMKMALEISVENSNPTKSSFEPSEKLVRTLRTPSSNHPNLPKTLFEPSESI